MGFFEEVTKDPQAVAWAERLAIIARRFRSKVVKSGWWRQFALLRKDRGEEEVERVLSWYEQHADDDYVPRASHAKVFREKFPQIARCMESVTLPAADLYGERVATRMIDRLKFPPNVQAVLPSIITTTDRAWAVFCSVMRDEMRKLNASDPQQLREIHFILHVGGMHAPSFVEDWCELLSKKTGHLPAYGGQLGRLAFRPESEWFHGYFWQTWAENWCRNPAAFDDLLGRLKVTKLEAKE